MTEPIDFSWFDKSPPNSDANLPAKLPVIPGDWVTLSFRGHDRATLADGHSLLTRQFYFEDFTDTNYPSEVRSRLVRFRPDGTLDYTADQSHPLSLDLSIDQTTAMTTRADTPIGVQLLVRGPAPVYLTTLGFRGVSVDALAERISYDVVSDAVRDAFEQARIIVLP